ncbi:Transcription factor bye1 [Malassezia psittaci]|uniref:Transcription factor BYE1 n=1 Tax=Malassezia psittaci TaxID=1821823 RepID=A0AAF0F277_9BASI|nr:Transcription factor bye1 [Malassezia psittaci]
MTSTSENTSLRRGSRSKRPAQRYEPPERASKTAESSTSGRSSSRSSGDRKAEEQHQEEHSEDSSSSDDEEYCICRGGNDGSPMICCSTCGEWYHFRCIGLTKKAAEKIDDYMCQSCIDKNEKDEQRVQQQQVDREEEYKVEDDNDDDDDDDDDDERDEEAGGESDAELQEEQAYESDEEPARKKPRASSRSTTTSSPRKPSRDSGTSSAGRSSVSRKPTTHKTSTGSLVKEPVRAHVLKTFSEIFTPLYQKAKSKNAEEQAERFSEELEQELHTSLGMRENGRLYKERFRTLAFNLKDPRNESLHQRITSGALSPKDLAELPNEQLANDAIREATEKAKRDALQQSLLREQGEGPARKITHKGEVDIERDDAAPYTAPDPRPEMLEPAPPEEEPTPEPIASQTQSPLKSETRISESPSGPVRPAVNFAEAWKSSTPVDHPEVDHADPVSPGFAYATGAESPPADDEGFLGEAHDVDSALDTFLDHDSEQQPITDQGVSQDAQKVGTGSTTPQGTPPKSSSLPWLKPPRSSSDQFSARPIVWDGVVTMPEFTSAYVHARPLSDSAPVPGSSLWNALFSGTECIVEGRLPSQTAIDYLDQVRHSPRNQIFVLALDAGGVAASDLDKETSEAAEISPSLEKLVRYFADKHRFGVLKPAPGMMGTLVKDFYLAPLRADEPVPDWVYTLHADGLGENLAKQRASPMLLAVVVLFRNALEAQLASDKSLSVPSIEALPALNASAKASGLSLDALLNVKPDAIQSLLSTLGSGTPPGPGQGLPGMLSMPPPQSMQSNVPPPPSVHTMHPAQGNAPPPPRSAYLPPQPRPMRQWGTGANATPNGWQPPPSGPPPPMPGWTPSRGGWYGGNPTSHDSPPSQRRHSGGRGARRGRR